MRSDRLDVTKLREYERAISYDVKPLKKLSKQDTFTDKDKSVTPDK